MAKAGKAEGESRKKEEAAALKAENKQQRKQSVRKWSNIVIGSRQKPLEKTTSAPPPNALPEGSFKKAAAPLKKTGSESAAVKLDGTASKPLPQGILKQAAGGVTKPLGEWFTLLS